MRYGNYEFRCRFDSSAELPEYKGSTFRGVFGRALKQVVCALKRQECPGCLLKSECLYPMIFEPQLSREGASERATSPPPHPYVIEPPLTEQTAFPAGAAFDFNLILFGPAAARLPYFVYAISEMGKIGIGKKLAGKRGRFVLEQVLSGGRAIYTHREQKLSETDASRDLALSIPEHPMNPIKTLTLHLETPLRLKYNNRFASELPFHVFVRAMLRRASSLLTNFNGGEPILDYSGMVKRAESVATTHSTLSWEDWRRYSLRQDEAMMLGGLKGAVTYSGDLGEFLPLIDFCAKVHLGKETTFGLGRFTMEAAP